MATGMGLIRPRDKDLSLRVFMECYQHRLPVIIEVTVGYQGQDGFLHEFSSDDVYFVCGVKQQKRMLLKDNWGRHVSIPINHTTKFHLLTEDGPSKDVMSIRYLAEHCKSIDDEDVFVMVENNSKLQFTLGVDYNDEQRLGRLRVVDTYMEKYLVGFSLFITRDRNGNIISREPVCYPTPMPIPVYMDIRVAIMTESKTLPLDELLKKLTPLPSKWADTPVNDMVMLLPEHLGDGDYEYIQPSFFEKNRMSKPSPMKNPSGSQIKRGLFSKESNNQEPILLSNGRPVLPLPPVDSSRRPTGRNRPLPSPPDKKILEASTKSAHDRELPILPESAPDTTQTSLSCNRTGKSMVLYEDTDIIYEDCYIKEVSSCSALTPRGADQQPASPGPPVKSGHGQVNTNQVKICPTVSDKNQLTSHRTVSDQNQVKCRHLSSDMNNERSDQMDSTINQRHGSQASSHVDGRIASIIPTVRISDKPVISLKPQTLRANSTENPSSISNNTQSPETYLKQKNDFKKAFQEARSKTQKKHSQSTGLLRNRITSTIQGIPDDLSALSVEEVAWCVKELGMIKYESIFLRRGVDGVLLLKMTSDAFKDMGMNDFDVLQITSFVDGWRPKIL